MKLIFSTFVLFLQPFVHPVPPPPSLAIANPHRSINYNSVMSSTPSVNMTSGPERGAQFSATPCLVNPPPIPPKVIICLLKIDHKYLVPYYDSKIIDKMLI